MRMRIITEDLNSLCPALMKEVVQIVLTLPHLHLLYEYALRTFETHSCAGLYSTYRTVYCNRNTNERLTSCTGDYKNRVP
jgi:hypothetical protein